MPPAEVTRSGGEYGGGARGGDGYWVAVRPARRWEEWLYLAVRALVAGFARLFWRVEIHGRENVPTSGPFILAPVHRSNVDFAIVALLARRRMRYLAKSSLWRWRWLGRLWFVLGAFPVNRGTPDRPALRLCVAVLDQGDPLVLFPEGTRQSGPEVKECFDGAAYVAGRTGVPIVPVGLGGTEAVMPKGAKWLRPHKVAVVVGEALPAPAAEEGGRVPRRVVAATTTELRRRIQELFDEAQRRAGTPNDPGR
jgi:1-acyl-sn-glycerol-3-phosphate acyltransferase